MKTIRDGALLLVLLMLLISVRVTPPEEHQGSIIPEARASMGPVETASQPAGATTPARLVREIELRAPDGQGDCPVRMKTIRTERGTAQLILIEVDEVETTEPAAPAVPAIEVPNTSC